MKNILLLSIIALLFAQCRNRQNSSTGTKLSGQGEWELVWADEFNYTGLPDSTKWSYQLGGSGWGNNEKQYYTHADSLNAKVNNGLLSIIARKQKFENREFTSARILSKNKGDWKYGKVEVRAMLPKGRGLWPAIWMLPTEHIYGNWPACGEIDIMEHVGYNPDSVFSTVHTKSFNHMIGTQKSKAIKLENAYNAFHIYSIEWDAEKIDFLVDGKLQSTFSNSGNGFAEWPYNQAFYLIMNLAVGGNWGGKYGIDETIFPATFKIDYVRVYKQAE